MMAHRAEGHDNTGRAEILVDWAPRSSVPSVLWRTHVWSKALAARSNGTGTRSFG